MAKKIKIEQGDMLIDLSTNKAWHVAYIGRHYRIDNAKGQHRFISLKELSNYKHIKND